MSWRMERTMFCLTAHMLPLYLVKHNALFCTNYTAYRKKLRQLRITITSISAVMIIVVTIFIAIFQNYRIVFLSRYFLCVRNDIFARHLRYASMIDSPPVYSSFSTLQSRFNHVPRTTWRVWLPPGERGWAASPSVKDAATAFEVTCHRWSPCAEPSLWRHNSQLPACVYVVAFKLVYLVQFEVKIRRALAYVQA